jgi:ribosome-dependent ATPase
MHVSKSAFTKELGPDLFMQDVIVLAGCIPVLWAVSTLALMKQER